ncbi:hypothetical protein ACHWQZ_G011597 [Mnemiopsis leidyi]
MQRDKRKIKVKKPWSPSTPKGRTTEQDSISEDDIVIQHEEGPKGTDSPQNTEPGPSVETDGESVSGMSEETYRSRTREVERGDSIL